jgi:hypothetical protein
MIEVRRIIFFPSKIGEKLHFAIASLQGEIVPITSSAFSKGSSSFLIHRFFIVFFLNRGLTNISPEENPFRFFGFY